MRELSQDKRVKTSPRSRLALLLALLLLGVASAACIQQTNEYPIEIFKEMHYAQFQRPQEPPRILPPASSVAYSKVGYAATGDPATILEVPAERTRPYDARQAAELYRVNCSVCHGIGGQGDGPNARHIASPDSFYATTTGAPYVKPPNLLAVQQARGCTGDACLTQDAAYSIVTNGINVMPKFGKLMSEEDIREVIAYVFDTETGLGTGR